MNLECTALDLQWEEFWTHNKKDIHGNIGLSLHIMMHLHTIHQQEKEVLKQAGNLENMQDLHKIDNYKHSLLNLPTSKKINQSILTNFHKQILQLLQHSQQFKLQVVQLCLTASSTEEKMPNNCLTQALLTASQLHKHTSKT